MRRRVLMSPQMLATRVSATAIICRRHLMKLRSAGHNKPSHLCEDTTTIRVAFPPITGKERTGWKSSARTTATVLHAPTWNATLCRYAHTAMHSRACWAAPCELLSRTGSSAWRTRARRRLAVWSSERRHDAARSAQDSTSSLAGRAPPLTML